MEGSVKYKSGHRGDRLGAKYETQDGRLFRCVPKENRKHAIELFESGLIDELMQKNLIPKVWMITKSDASDNMLIEEEKIPYIVQPYEWSFHMLYIAGKMVLTVNELALKYGYYLADPHVYNVMFKGTVPLYVDMGSFQKIPNRGRWCGYDKILHDFVYPLKIASDRHGGAAPTIARRIMGICIGDIDPAEYQSLFGMRRFYILERLRRKFRLPKLVENMCFGKSMIYVRYRNQTQKLGKMLDKYHFEDIEKWSNYQNDYQVSDVHNGRFERLCELLNKAKITSSFEVGGNQGVFSAMLLKRGIVQRALCSDCDRGAIDKGFMQNTDNDSMYFCVYNLLDLTEVGQIDRSERFKSDIVIALALTHHLILAQNLRLQWIFEVLAAFTRKYVLIEFMPLGLGGRRSSLPTWYTLEWFESEMERYFEILEVLHIDRKRIAILGRIKG